MLERVGEYILHQRFCDGDNLALGKTGTCHVRTCLCFALIPKAVVPHRGRFIPGTRFLFPFSASAMSNSASAGGAVDGLHTIHSCYRSQSRGPHWWMVDLGRETAIGKIRFTVTVSGILVH